MFRLVVPFALLVAAANLAAAHLPWLPLGPLSAPSGVLFIGLLFLLRDRLQRLYGLPAVTLAVLLGALATSLSAPAFAVASLVAFVVSELVDSLIYSVAGRVPSNLAGSLVDSVLFLSLAFGSLHGLLGLFLWKAAPSLLLLLPRLRRPAVAVPA